MHPGTLKAARDASSVLSEHLAPHMCPVLPQDQVHLFLIQVKLPVKLGPLLINMIFDSSFPVEMFGESGSCTDAERLQIHDCWHGTGLCVVFGFPFEEGIVRYSFLNDDRTLSFRKIGTRGCTPVPPLQEELCSPLRTPAAQYQQRRNRYSPISPGGEQVC